MSGLSAAVLEVQPSASSTSLSSSRWPGPVSVMRVGDGGTVFSMSFSSNENLVSRVGVAHFSCDEAVK